MLVKSGSKLHLAHVFKSYRNNHAVSMLSHRRRLACLEATVDSCPLLARRANKRSKTPVEAARFTRETSTVKHETHL